MRRFVLPSLAVGCLALTLGLPVDARDLGVRGATWPVAEPDLLVAIEARLAEMRRSGEMARLEAEARARRRRWKNRGRFPALRRPAS